MLASAKPRRAVFARFLSSLKEFRKRAEDFLVRVDPANMSQEDLNLFYPAEESEEFV